MQGLGPGDSALDLAAALRAGELSSLELLEACLEATDARDPDLNAIVWRDDEAAREAARDADSRLAAGEEAPFLGVPIPIKDLTPVAGWPVAYGSAAAPDAPSERSELVVESLLRAGFVLCGRTNAPEFGPLTVAENARYGLTRNPWDMERSSGGSSGGASAAVAGGMFPLAHANDGGGSIRIPAAYCGLVGLKPSRGRVPRLAQSWMGAVVEGAITRTVADAAAVLDAISAFDPLAWYNAPAPARPFAEEAGMPAEPLRIGLMERAPLGIPTDPACSEAARVAAAALEELGHEVIEVEVATVSEELSGPFVVMASAGSPTTTASTGRRSSRTTAMPTRRRRNAAAPTSTSPPRASWRSSRGAKSPAGVGTSTSCSRPPRRSCRHRRAGCWRLSTRRPTSPWPRP